MEKLFNLNSKVKLNIKGKNINNFIKRLNNNKINLLKISNLKYNEVTIVINKVDYEKLMKLKTIYEVTESDIYGIIKVQKIIDKYKYFLTFLFLGFIFLIFLSNIIFNVEVISTDASMRNLLLNELEERGIKKYSFKKNYEEIKNIKGSILEKYKDQIEWLEIENVGTKYIVRVEDRIIFEEDEQLQNQNIVAKKSSIIKKIIAYKGNVIKELNEHVTKGEVIISGEIFLNEELKDTISAKGIVYGEVWYNVTVEYPYVYSEVRETGNTKNAYVLKILNKEIELSFNKYKQKYVDNLDIFRKDILPIKLMFQRQRETEVISYILNEEEAIEKAIDESINKMKSRLKENEEIIKYQVLSKEIKEDKVVVSVFFSVLENITDYNVIER